MQNEMICDITIFVVLHNAAPVHQNKALRSKHTRGSVREGQFLFHWTFAMQSFFGYAYRGSVAGWIRLVWSKDSQSPVRLVVP